MLRERAGAEMVDDIPVYILLPPLTILFDDDLLSWGRGTISLLTSTGQDIDPSPGIDHPAHNTTVTRGRANARAPSRANVLSRDPIPCNLRRSDNGIASQHLQHRVPPTDAPLPMRPAA